MRPLQILASPLKIRGHIQIVHPMGVNNLELNEEMEEEIVEQIALPFPRWNCKEMIIDPVMIIYWLKCIFDQSVAN